VKRRIERRIVLGALLLNGFLLASAFAASGDKNDKTVKPGSSVDSGAFGIYVNSKRVATESFHVEQRSDLSTISSELKFDDSNVQAVQTSELQLLPSGLLKKYTWKETRPGKSQIIVEPQDEQFLVAHVMESATDTGKDSVHPLSPATSILDDNFFSQMEVLAWKYMAFSCRAAVQGIDCKWGTQRMPIFVPHQQQSMIVEIAYTGVNKMKLKGAEAEYKSFKLQSESGDWQLWFDAQNKLVRVFIPAENTEVLRD
jgi:hypothetical protein